MNITKTGEFFVPHISGPYEIKVNMERYLFALQFCKDKVVLDASCGAGLGTYLYSLVAKKVFAIDYNDDALEYAKQNPIQKDKVHFIKANLEKDILPEHDICISLETIEHLENPDFFLSQLKGDKIVFSIPLNSLAVSQFHKYDFVTANDIAEVMERYYKIDDYFEQYGKWVYGKGIKL